MYNYYTPTLRHSQVEPRPIGRRIKAHRKSRQGCFTCKGRKVKCCESRPRCSNCARANVRCVYPDSMPVALTPVTGSLQSYGSTFSLSDMRLFHNFMTASFPHLPIDGERAWRNEVPVIAQQHEFLMHAILSLGASHLHARTNLDLKQSVERHRALALRGLTTSRNELTDTPGANDGNGDYLNAQLATAYALTFCASYMGDPMSQFLVLVRGCASLSAQIMRSGHNSPLFPNGGKSVSHYDHLEAMRERLATAPALPDSGQGRDAKLSLRATVEYCTLSAVEAKIVALMERVVNNIDTPIVAYESYVDIWNIFTDMSTEEFSHFVEPSNTAGIAIQAHFLALEKLIRPWLMYHAPTRRQDDSRARCSVDTLQAIAGLDTGSAKLLEWPLRYFRDSDEGVP